MGKKSKVIYLLISSFVISLLYLPFAFARPASETVITSKRLNDSAVVIPTAKSIYDSLQLSQAGLNPQAFEYALLGWEKLVDQGKLSNQSIIAIVDFSQPSTQKRLYVIDIKNYELLFNTLVAHGRNSGKQWATHFSNKLSSYRSSPGFYVTGDTYNGGNGYSLKLHGIENGINDKASRRAIVMHGADYVHESYITSQGYLGRSQGCPAVPLKDAKNIINTIKDGTCLYIYTPDQHYSSRSKMVKEDSRS